MNKLSAFMKSCSEAWERGKPARQKVAAVFASIGRVFRGLGQWIYRLRSIFLAAPVVLAALRLAEYNREHLPEMVGIDLLETGQYAHLIERDMVILWPLIITGGCLLLMFLSRRVIYPWIISIFTLVIPIVIYITNIFPA